VIDRAHQNRLLVRYCPNCIKKYAPGQTGIGTSLGNVPTPLLPGRSLADGYVSAICNQMAKKVAIEDRVKELHGIPRGVNLAPGGDGYPIKFCGKEAPVT